MALHSAASTGESGARGRPATARLMMIYSSIGLAVALSRFLLRARWPDDYDSFGFLLSVRDSFDLSAFQPQFPGYPVYVAAASGLVRLGVPPLSALEAISALASGATASALAVIANEAAGLRAAAVTCALYSVAWQPLLLGGGALSDSLGASLAVTAFALTLAARPRLGAAGFVGALLLGARLSYWPLAGSLALFVRARGGASGVRRFLSGVGLGLLAWMPAFIVRVGAASLWRLGVEHVQGHFRAWGNTALTRPEPGGRLASFWRDVFYDGVAPGASAAAWVCALTLIALLHRPSRARLGPRRAWLLAAVPYALWAYFGQNVLTQPRHALPLVLVLVLLLGISLSAHAALAMIAVLVVASVSLPLAWARHVTPPAPAQAARWVAARFQGEAAWTAIFANRSARFFTEARPPGPATWIVHSRLVLGDVYSDVVRFDRFPRHIVLTDEVAFSADGAWRRRLPGRIVDGPRFCRDERIDRAVPCVQLYELVWHP